MATLVYEKEKNPYSIPNINLQTSEILVNKGQFDKLNDGAIQLVEVEVYGKIWPSK